VNRLSLRARLVLGVIALAVVGLAAANIATYTSLRSFLFDRTDHALDAAHHAVEQALLRPDGPGHGRGGGPAIDALQAAVGGDYIELRTLDGAVVESGTVREIGSNEARAPPRLPKSIELGDADDEGDRVVYFTTDATSGGDRYRIRASIEPQASQYVLVIGAPLTEVDSTLHRLLLIELLVTVLVLAAIAALGLWVVGLGLRPLAAIGSTADAIAAGDLSRRVDRAESRTEVGRLGLALNAMLGQIESAFRAREASERKLRRFVADASHELRTPLAAVRAYAELFTRGAAERPADLARSMNGITRESERMSLLVDDLLLLARLDEGRPLEREPVALEQVVADAVETAQTVEPDRPIELAADQAVVVGDRDRLRQIVDNLLANVRAHTPPGTPVRVTLSRRNGSAEIAVADSGPGLDEEQAAHVFERFYRTDSSRTRASGGVGLGLSIVAAVAEAHGGSVSADAGAGTGATFRIELPLQPPAHSDS
jgi:two-component system OmpR family sensor kinase